ncbi:unnamed protein product [Cladocopium goreaui]|uniref:Non-specific serine/threonine protein kinase n=1 Tax=Cladocopium goreaui TaxID=2562237 RepID=A0A9P1C2M0_9DINO|nr:unnamed protein product [Cladocopium goreaui]
MNSREVLQSHLPPMQVATMTRLKVERRKDPILLAAVKTGRRSVRNRAELLEWLAAAAQSRRLSFEKLDFDMPLKEQARLLAASQLLVASMGATLMAGLLLSADAALLALPACHKVGPGRSVTCETEELLKSCGLRWAQYPVAFDDVFYTIGRGFDFTARREIVNELIKELLEA